jgi:hypothetical protein
VTCCRGEQEQLFVVMRDNFYEELMCGLMERIPIERRVARRFTEKQHRQAASDLSRLMISQRPFSYIRMGDMELGLLLAQQHGADPGWEKLPLNQARSSKVVFTHPGIGQTEVPRLRRAYERADFVDFHNRAWVNRELLPMLQLDRSPDAAGSEGEEDSIIFVPWLRYEFRNYTNGRRCLFAGGEASLLRELWSDDRYREVAKEIVNFDCVAFFEQQYRVTGRIDEIKEKLKQRISDDKIDTLFLSLGGAAKALCVEIAEETGICTFDFGSLMRSLTYAGSDGRAFYRSAHHPFVFRVPFDVYMDAMERAHLDMNPEERLVKAQCQVHMDAINFQEGEVKGTIFQQASNRELFAASYRRYKQRYGRMEKLNEEARRVALEFHLEVVGIIHGTDSAAYLIQKWIARFGRLRAKLIGSFGAR